MPVVQECSEPGCHTPAAFGTRTKPTWCDDHITAILRQGGLEPLEPFTKQTAWRLTRCLNCGCQAHYRFVYTLDQNAMGQATCRACFWRGWAGHQRSVLSGYVDMKVVPLEEARTHAESHGYDYLGPLTEPSLPHDPHRVQCQNCHRIRAVRLGDIGFGCDCLTLSSTSRWAARSSGRGSKDLMKDSGAAALGWWDHETNDSAAWETATTRATRAVNWQCPDCGVGFSARIRDMLLAADCPDCEPQRRAIREAERAAAARRHETTTISQVPELLAAWADEADPARTFLSGSNLRRFRCPKGHHPRMTPLSFLRSGCPSCRGNTTRRERLEAVALDPDAHGINREVAAQWHPTKNGKTKLETLSPASRRVFWWREPSCGHEWQEGVSDRDSGRRYRCPECGTILDSLAYHFPEVAAEWSPENPRSAWNVRPTSQTDFTPVWICSRDSTHSWRATLMSRTNGSGCPECRESGKSKVELAHHAAAKAVFGRAASGQAVHDEAFRRRKYWLVDIVTDLQGQRIAIEYDGSYWHSDKEEIDTAKSEDLLAAGFFVVRLREHPLRSLGLRNDRYSEIIVYANKPDPDDAIKRARTWAEMTLAGAHQRAGRA